MTSILPGLVYGVIHFDTARLVSSPVEVITLLIRAMFLFDVCFGTIGYVLTMRPLDSHIRSPNPFVAGWIAALVCYPPFLLMGAGGPLDYRAGTQEWTVWFAAQHGVLLLWGCAILALIFVYAWATVIFGIRFSNLNNRGIITNGPYRYFKHPAYLSKNVAWWLIHVPFLSSLGPAEALQNCMLLLLVNGIYYLRARTEEQHLMADARYRAYAEWIAENGVLERLMSAVRGGWSMVSAALASPARRHGW
jgi:isoprenylcysteine carboxyl methyltransferase (ICMT) family protein YpbQ